MTLLFDLINTAIKFNFDPMFARFSRWSGFDPDHIRTILWDGKNCDEKALMRPFMLGQISEEDFLYNLRKELKINPEVGDWLLSEAFLLYFEIDPRILKLFYFLREKKIKLGLISNIDPMAWRFIQNAFPVFSIFDFCILSYQERLLKPDIEVFRLARARARDGIICFFDDREENCEGAEMAGIHAVLVGGDPYKDIVNAFCALGISVPPVNFQPSNWGAVCKENVVLGLHEPHEHE